LKKDEKEEEEEEIQRNKKKRSCNEIIDSTESNSKLSSSNYKYQGKRPKPIYSNKNYSDNPFKYTFIKSSQNQNSSLNKNVSLMSLFLEFINKGRNILFIPAHIIDQSFNLINSFCVFNDNQSLKSATISNETTKFDKIIKNNVEKNGNTSSSTEMNDDHFDEMDKKYMVCKYYCCKVKKKKKKKKKILIYI